MNTCRLLAVQMPVTAGKEENLCCAEQLVKAHAGQADVAVLPEIFNSPYATSCFPVYAEEEGGESWRRMSALAKTAGMYLVAGSIPERDAAGHVYNTCFVFDREGRQIAKHRKVHLFDIDVRGGQYFRESDTLTPGEAVTVFDTEFGKMGVCICYDIRFPEIFRMMADAGARLVFVPAAFNMTTGPAHWELTFRARALDNQMFLCGCSQARDPEGGYVAWGHTILTDPWGEVLEQLDEKAGVLKAEIDLDRADDIRTQLPLLAHRRKELYRL